MEQTELLISQALVQRANPENIGTIGSLVVLHRSVRPAADGSFAFNLLIFSNVKRETYEVVIVRQNFKTETTQAYL